MNIQKEKKSTYIKSIAFATSKYTGSDWLQHTFTTDCIEENEKKEKNLFILAVYNSQLVIVLTMRISIIYNTKNHSLLMLRLKKKKKITKVNI